jgi:hypothetical protein
MNAASLPPDHERITETLRGLLTRAAPVFLRLWNNDIVGFFPVFPLVEEHQTTRRPAFARTTADDNPLAPVNALAFMTSLQMNRRYGIDGGGYIPIEDVTITSDGMLEVLGSTRSDWTVVDIGFGYDSAILREWVRKTVNAREPGFPHAIPFHNRTAVAANKTHVVRMLNGGMLVVAAKPESMGPGFAAIELPAGLPGNDVKLHYVDKVAVYPGFPGFIVLQSGDRRASRLIVEHVSYEDEREHSPLDSEALFRWNCARMHQPGWVEAQRREQSKFDPALARRVFSSDQEASIRAGLEAILSRRKPSNDHCDVAAEVIVPQRSEPRILSRELN